MTKAEIVSQISYKPGWVFSATEDRLTIELDVESSRGDGPLHLKFEWGWENIDYPADEVWQRVNQIERHEMREWFRVEGHLVHDPHVWYADEFNFIDKRLV